MSAGGGYTKIREIGSGSFGRAYLVQAPKKNGDDEKRLLVMKQIDVSRMDKRERASAETEVKCLSSLKHPYVVKYWESFMHDRFLCIVMDYCEGGDLFQLIQSHKQRGRPIPEGSVLQWFTQVTLAMKYVHDRRILHRDIKSQNVLLTGKDGRTAAKLADFGISKFLEGPNALARTVVGTPYYLSPEMVQKQPYSWASDVWALGCVLYEMCALRVPFDANDMRQLVDKIIRTNAPRIPSSYSRELVDLCAEMLLRESARRPTAAALVQLPLIQKEIKRMLTDTQKEEGLCGAVGAPAGGAQKEGGVPESGRRPLGDHNHRGPSPSAGSKPNSRCPSPAPPSAHRQVPPPSPSAHRHISPHRGNSPHRRESSRANDVPKSARQPSPRRDPALPPSARPSRGPTPPPSGWGHR